MKILHVTNYDCRGGAGIAAFRLHQALRADGIDSRMLVRRKLSNDPYVEEIGELTVRARGWLGAKLTKAIGMEGCSLNMLPTGLHKILNASDADVIHLHWINNEMISITEIAKIKKPLVWTLHDCWPLMGAEHHSDADYWRKERLGGDGCGSSGVSKPKTHSLRSKGSSAVNLWIFKKKQRAWKNLSVHLIAPSNWMAKQVRQSNLFAAAPVKVIPNGLDLNVFKPMDKAECRRQLNLPCDKKLILFGAYNPNDPNKGYDLLELTLAQLPEQERMQTEVIVYGAQGWSEIAGLKTHWRGVIEAESELARLYNAVDVFVCPSRRENLPNTIAEAMACGVPCAGFVVGGIPDMVDHQVNGWLAEPYSIEDLGKGLAWILEPSVSQGQRDRLLDARSKAGMFSKEKIAKEYVKIYASTLHGSIRAMQNIK